MAASGKSIANQEPATSFPAEVELLLRVARAAIRCEPCRIEPAPSLDWRQLVRLAEMHGLEAFLLQARDLLPQMPPQLESQLRRNVSDIAARNLVLGREAIQVSQQLQDAGIEHVVYKGPGLAQMLYGTVATRPSRDIDLIVKPEQAEKAFEVLTSRGYKDKDNLDGRQRSAAIRFASEQCFAKDGIEIDLHWKIAPQSVTRGLDTVSMWGRIASAKLFNAHLPTFCAEDLFVALSLHAGEHAWSQISLFCDLGRLLEVTPAFDWDVVRSHLSDANTRRTVEVTVLLLANGFGAVVPPDLLRREMHVELLAARVACDFWPAPEQSAHKETDLGWIRERCRGERLKDRMRWISGVFLTPTLADFQQFRLPERLQVFYPALRLVRLAIRRALPARMAPK